MGQQIICQKGKCFEIETIESEIDSLFDETNIVHRIQRYQLKNMIR